MKTIVFLGPTLSLAEAKAIFPEACYHPPARCGDILRVLRLKPKSLILIDGYFETTPSVWHKELLFAMEKGVAVYGASSMGALRAAELADFGMVGVGRVFQDYYDSLLNEDDAVAVLHGAQNGDYRQTCEALVDFRATLEKHCAEDAIPDRQKNEMLKEMANWFYPERSIGRLQSMGKEQDQWAGFYRWIHKNGLVRQKTLDAIEVLKLVRNSSTIPKKSLNPVPKTSFLCALVRKINVSPFQIAYEWLPQEERDLVADAQGDSQIFPVLSEMAFALSVIHDLARSHPPQRSTLSFDSFSGFSWGKTLIEAFADSQNDSVVKDIYLWASAQVATHSSASEDIANHFYHLTYLLGYESQEGFSEKIHRALSQFAFLFFGIDCFLETYPYIFEWKNGYAQHIVGKYYSLDKIIRSAVRTSKSKEKQTSLIIKTLRYYSVFKGALYNSIAPTHEVESLNWLVIGKRMICGNSAIREPFPINKSTV